MGNEISAEETSQKIESIIDIANHLTLSTPLHPDGQKVQPNEFKSRLKTKDFNDQGLQQVLINFKSQAKAQQYDIYYFCDINNQQFYGDAGYQIFPRQDDYFENQMYYPFCNQFEPSFNFNGSKVAFLNQRINPDERSRNSEPCASDKDIDLWVFDVYIYHWIIQ